MRRTAGLIVGTCALIACAQVAAAALPAASGPGPARPAAGGVGALGAATGDVDSLRAAAGGPERVGTTLPVHATLNAGRPSMTLSYPGASYVKVHLARLLLAPGGYLTVSDPAGQQVHRYSASLLGPLEGRQRDGMWAMSIEGDAAVLRLSGALPRVPGTGVVVDRVARGFTPVEREAAKGADRARRDAAVVAMRTGSRGESICGGDDSLDAVCYRSSDPVLYANSLAVARILVDGDELCSAWRVGPRNRMFTNNHCLTNSAQARDTEIWFNYQCGACGGMGHLPATKVFGAQVLSTDGTLDYTLFTVDDFPAIQRYGYLTLDVRDPGRGEELYIPQHPEGDPTVVAMASDRDPGGNCQVRDPAANGYGPDTDISYYCDTAGGSSGSPVISRVTNRVIALHHFGGCPNGGVRIDLIYARVANLL